MVCANSFIANSPAGKGHNVDSLSARCGVSRRTVFRDLDVLRQTSVPLKYDEEFQVYHLADTDFLPPTISGRDHGTLVSSAKVKGLSEVSWWILGYGDQAEVVKPTALRKMIATHAGQMLRKYEND
jgi:predicted DNA-binding transcriptional regulator YafY